MGDHIQIGDISPRVQYVGTSTETTFTYTFPIFKDADLEVYIDGVLQTLTIDYSITGAGASSGGEVTFVAAPATDEKVTLVRRLAIQRTSDFQASGEFRAKVINDELDFQTAALQQIEDDLSRALRLKRDDAAAALELPLVAERANKLIGFDDQGNAQLSNLTITEMEQGATGPAGPNGPMGPAGMDGLFSGDEATVVPALDDALAFTDTSDSEAPKFASVESILSTINLLSDDGANLSPDTDWVMYFDTSSASIKKMHPEDIGGGGLQSVQVFAVSGTWSKPAGINLIKVTVVGGGGGGGKASAGTNRANGGGGAGGAAIEWIDVSALGSSVSVTIGVGGAGATSGYSNGNAGSTSSFGSYCSATGGAGGETENFGGDGGQGGIGSGGDINISGGPGGSMGQTGDYTGGGFGGSSIFGGGGVGQGGNGSAAGQNGRSPGGGGAGGHHTAVAGNGATGLVLIEEYA